MDSQLKALISLCEEEKLRLLNLINSCLADEEYLLAHYHSNALYQLNGRLQTLKNIEDSHYDAKQYKLRTISGLKKELENTDSEYMIQYFQKELAKANEALEKLNETSPKHTTTETTSLLDNTLARLLENEVKDVKLIPRRNVNFVLAFSVSNSALKVTIPYLKTHLKKWVLHDSKVEKLKRIGFDITGNGNSLIMEITGDKQSILSKLKIVLSKIIFEMFYYKEFDKESYIQFTEKARR